MLFMDFFIVDFINFASRRKIINHLVAGETRESHPCDKDLRHPRLGNSLVMDCKSWTLGWDSLVLPTRGDRFLLIQPHMSSHIAISPQTL